MKTFNTIGVIFFAYTNQSALLPIYKELYHPIRRRFTKFIFRADLIIIFLFLAIPTFGYLSTLQLTTSVIVVRPMPFGIDYLQVVAVCAVLLVLIIKMTLNVFPFKINICQLICGN
mmetsp:Transcript_1729/g.1188  ORF Transcript_1729/g.1188 Transcript_1729/m.1188 type:complete len:116 (+) Transcript_1729:782-1129(+)